jgi:hypothetical protein
MDSTNKYLEGKIYKIISSQTPNVYIGSTCEPKLCRRMTGHRRQYGYWKKNNKRYYSSFEILKYDDAKIILIEKFSCFSKDELVSRENFYVNSTPNCINNYRPKRSKKEYYNDNKEMFQYWNKEYYNSHKKSILEQAKELYNNNSDKYKLKNDIYYQNNKHKIMSSGSKSEICNVCGKEYTLGHKSRHIKTIFHQKYNNIINSIKNIDIEYQEIYLKK